MSKFNFDAGDYVDSQLHRVDWLIANMPWIYTPSDVFGDHDMNCGDPNATHRDLKTANPDWHQYFWYCMPGGNPAAGHMMTGFDWTGYGIFSFSPNQVMNNVHKVCWSVNATDEGGGKWTNMQVIPEALYQRFAPRMDYVVPGFNTDGQVGDFSIQAGDHPGTDVFGIKDFRGTQTLFVGGNVPWDSGTQSYTTTDHAARFQHCLENTSATTSHLMVNRPDGSVSMYNLPRAIPQGQVRIIFQDDMYDPPKRDGYNPQNVTFHWDDVSIS
jgi:hypothetical protein